VTPLIRTVIGGSGEKDDYGGESIIQRRGSFGYNWLAGCVQGKKKKKRPSD